jgi:predicted enzyme related to lactoylglutathione lyase
MTQITQFSSLAIDANDPERLATFWAAMLGGTIALDDDSDARVTVPTGPKLDFLRVPEPKSVKGRLHLDVWAEDVEAATRSAIELGATRADDVYNGGRWQVLRDPEGNEFCILPPEYA